MGINSVLLQDAINNLYKQGFVAAGDPAMGAPADPAAGGAPMDPAAMGGGMPADPAAMGGGGGGGDPMAALMPAIQQMVQQAVASSGAAAGGGAGGGMLKPKIDINVEIMQMKKLLARLCDAMGVAIPAAEMVATPDDLSQMASQQQGGAPAAGALGSIQPMQPMKAAYDNPWEYGSPYSELVETQKAQQSNAFKAIAALKNRQNGV